MTRAQPTSTIAGGYFLYEVLAGQLAVAVAGGGLWAALTKQRPIGPPIKKALALTAFIDAALLPPALALLALAP